MYYFTTYGAKGCKAARALGWRTNADTAETEEAAAVAGDAADTAGDTGAAPENCCCRAATARAIPARPRWIATPLRAFATCTQHTQCTNQNRHIALTACRRDVPFYINHSLIYHLYINHYLSHIWMYGEQINYIFRTAYLQSCLFQHIGSIFFIKEHLSIQQNLHYLDFNLSNKIGK